MTLEPGTYASEWFTVEQRQTITGEPATVTTAAATDLRLPATATGPIVLYLHAEEVHPSGASEVR